MRFGKIFFTINLTLSLLVPTPGVSEPAVPAPRRSNVKNPAWSDETLRPVNVPAAPKLPATGAIGLSLQVPEVGAIEAVWRPSRWVALRAFAAPPIKFNIRVELPEDRLGAKSGVVIENPAVEILFKATYGPNYGFDGLFFPFATGFYIGGGVAHRSLRLVGGGQTPLIIRPEAGGESSITTRTEFGLHGDALTTSYMARGTVGYLLMFKQGLYFNIAGGVAKPFAVKKQIDIKGIVDSPSVSDAEIRGALDVLKDTKADELESKALAEMQPAIEKTLPIVSLGLGYAF